ncbi:hypothetical protein L4C34_08290 [Vibrio profundum]|uniref:hypothetical protein n=1 Tax=Vibrio profundum TaxID=2910247 RepID=UPI003D12B428
MKKVLFASLVLVLLAACASSQNIWGEDNQAQVSGQSVSMKSNLWVTNVPASVEGQDQTLHGTLYLESKHSLPANLDVVKVSIKQGTHVWTLTEDQLALQSNYENQWEVSFEWPKVPVNLAKSVDVAMKLGKAGQAQWLVDKHVQVNAID